MNTRKNYQPGYYIGLVNNGDNHNDEHHHIHIKQKSNEININYLIKLIIY